MTVIRIDHDSLWIHSPIEPTVELTKELEALGTIKAVVSPNSFHHLYARSFLQSAPHSEYYYAPGIEKKRASMMAELQHKQALSADMKTWWNDEIETLKISGMPIINEFVFYHKQSRTLIASDLLFRLKRNNGLLQRILFPILGIKNGQPGQSRLFKLCIRDKREYNSAIEKIAQWDIERLIVGHGGSVSATTGDIVPQLIAV